MQDNLVILTYPILFAGSNIEVRFQALSLISLEHLPYQFRKPKPIGGYHDREQFVITLVAAI
jgi:hypothetical protein